jgi:hypothetical protein
MAVDGREPSKRLPITSKGQTRLIVKRNYPSDSRFVYQPPKASEVGCNNGDKLRREETEKESAKRLLNSNKK